MKKSLKKGVMQARRHTLGEGDGHHVR